MRPERASCESGSVITHVSYHEEQYDSAIQCLAAIRNLVGLGWDVSWVSGPHGQTYRVCYRREGSGRALALVEP